MERNPLSKPLPTSGNSMYNKEPAYKEATLNNLQNEVELRNFDLKNPDTQYLRYKQLMNSQYYNL